MTEGKAKRWFIPATIVEHGREVCVEAETRAEAMRKFRCGDWLECADAGRFKVTKVGPIRMED